MLLRVPADVPGAGSVLLSFEDIVIAVNVTAAAAAAANRSVCCPGTFNCLPLSLLNSSLVLRSLRQLIVVSLLWFVARKKCMLVDDVIQKLWDDSDDGQPGTCTAAHHHCPNITTPSRPSGHDGTTSR
jgi:hypothetical protein